VYKEKFLKMIRIESDYDTDEGSRVLTSKGKIIDPDTDSEDEDLLPLKKVFLEHVPGRADLLKGVSSSSKDESTISTTSNRADSSGSSVSPRGSNFPDCVEGISSDEDMDSGILSLNTSLKNDVIKPGLVFDTHCHFEFIQKRMSKFVYLSECLELDGEELGDKFVGCIVNYCQPSEWSGGEDHDQLSSLLLSSASDARVGIAIGCHPHFGDQMTEQKWKQFESLISKDEYPNLSIVAVGECGLDNSRKNSVPRIIQVDVFKRQLMLALKYNLPLVLHIRDAMQDGLEVLESVGVPQDYPIHLHCFTSSLEVAHKWLNKYSECKIGFTGLITFPQSWQLREVVKEIPLDKLLLETDAPYFLPHNATTRVHNCAFPGHVIHVAAKVAEIKEISLEKVLEQNLRNSYLIYKQFFLNKPSMISLKARRAEGNWNSPQRMNEESKDDRNRSVTSYRPKLSNL